MYVQTVTGSSHDSFFNSRLHRNLELIWKIGRLFALRMLFTMPVSIVDILNSGFTLVERHTTSFLAAKNQPADNKYSPDRKREMQLQRSSAVE